jgi:hypothetical protein
MSKITDAATMTAEAASKTEATKGKPEPAYRKPTQTRAGRLRQQMTAAYTAALGGAGRVNAIQLEDIHRAVDLVMLASEMRAAVRQGTAKVSDLTRLEGAADRAVRRLCLKPGAVAAAIVPLRERLRHGGAG